MKTLWTPWRMEYVTGQGEREPGCLFEKAAGRKHDRRHFLLYRDGKGCVFMNRFPYANGHLLIAPERHVADLADLHEDELLHLAILTRNCIDILRRHLHPDGFNIGLNLGKTAGAGLEDHLHYHIVPRWEGDHNFMTVLAEVRNIPEHLDSTFERLLPAFLALDGKISSSRKKTSHKII
jgi:ATP adenylyltransferase